jgi:plasmid stabilization system protein ParE
VKIRFTPTSRVQFLSAVAYIQRDDPEAAARFFRRASSALRRLRRFPRSGRVVPEFPELPYREIVMPPYRFFYRIEDNIIWIAAVWHGAQIPESPAR